MAVFLVQVITLGLPRYLLLEAMLRTFKLHAAQGAWDFSDEEEFSDDEKKVRFKRVKALVIEPKQ